jgi:tetratricopeptide (TPR) repeat protein
MPKVIPQPKNKKDILIVALIFLLAFSLRFIYLEQVKTNPFFKTDDVLLDSYLYDQTALKIINNQMDKEVYMMMPGYAYFLAFSYKIFGHNFFLIRIIQMLFGAATAVFIYLIALRLFNRPVAIISALTFCFYGVFFFFEGLILGLIFGAYYNLGLLYKEQNKDDEAIVNLEKCRELSPNFLDCLTRLAQIYDKKGLTEKRDALLKRIEEIKSRR